MSKKKILFFLINTRWFERRLWLTIPYPALIVSELLHKDYDFFILDANGQNYSEEKCLKIIKEFEPDMVMISGVSCEYHNHFLTGAALAKSAAKNAIVVMGGVHPTVLGEEVMKSEDVDYIFIGHAEERVLPFVEILFSSDMQALADFGGVGFRDSNNKVIINPVTSYIGDVKKMIQPNYKGFDLEPYLMRKTKDYQISSDVRSAPILTSYGCFYNCLFCATRTISGHKVSYRDTLDVMEELTYLATEHQVKDVIFIDDCFLCNRRRVDELLNLMIDSGLGLTWKAATVSAWHLDDELLELIKASGCSQITISVESGHPRVLKEIIKKPLKLEIIPPIIKKCKEIGITIAANFVLGFPGETWDEIRHTIRYAEEMDFDLVHFHIATPLPKTDLFNLAVEQKMLPPDFDFVSGKYTGFCQGFITTDEFTPQELMILRAYEYDRINFSTPEKRERMARTYRCSLEELEEHRRQTRRKLGVHTIKEKVGE